jgi:hypothetical protein
MKYFEACSIKDGFMKKFTFFFLQVKGEGVNYINAYGILIRLGIL